jgi:hypothetical protein
LSRTRTNVAVQPRAELDVARRFGFAAAAISRAWACGVRSHASGGTV